MNFTGTTIEESLADRSIFSILRIVRTRLKPVTVKHQTPLLAKWTMHDVEVPVDEIAGVARILSQSLDSSGRHGHWYADLKSDRWHYVIFPAKIFRVDRGQPDMYQSAIAYGLSLGIPGYQLDFSPDIENWEHQ